MKTRDEIVQAELENTIIESAAIKLRTNGGPLRCDQVNEAVADFLRQYDWIPVFWPEPRNPSGIGAAIVRDTGKDGAFVRCQSLPCANRETALKLYELCSGRPDNHAPEFPAEPAGNA